ncbi:hypothetical protein, partial [Ursidibacter maritimus]|uniref:hypothetical protein n=1 Tax=Ursidibacter maritimus TaxID=1331689 RepID=UPI001C496914
MITANTFPNLPIEEAHAVQLMHERITNHRARHKVREHYFEGSNALKDLGISIPPSLRNLEVALGWPSKAVNSLSQRVQMEGFVLPDSTPSEWGIDQVMFENRLDVEITQV